MTGSLVVHEGPLALREDGVRQSRARDGHPCGKQLGVDGTKRPGVEFYSNSDLISAPSPRARVRSNWSSSMSNWPRPAKDDSRRLARSRRSDGAAAAPSSAQTSSYRWRRVTGRGRRNPRVRVGMGHPGIPQDQVALLTIHKRGLTPCRTGSFGCNNKNWWSGSCTPHHVDARLDTSAWWRCDPGTTTKPDASLL